MVRAFYMASNGMLTMSRTMDVISQNIANINTPGYKRDTLVNPPYEFRDVYRQEHGAGDAQTPLNNDINLMRWQDSVATWYEQGALLQTDRTHDLCLTGDGFFTIQMPDGDTQYTRNGQFARDGEGYLVTPQGGRLMGENGPIIVPDAEFEVDAHGAVYELAFDDTNIYRERGELLDVLEIYVPADYETLQKNEEGYFIETAQDAERLEFIGGIRQGWIEDSNVNITRELSNMMEKNRIFQTNAQALKMIDQILAKAVSDVGRLV